MPRVSRVSSCVTIKSPKFTFQQGQTKAECLRRLSRMPMEKGALPAFIPVIISTNYGVDRVPWDKFNPFNLTLKIVSAQPALSRAVIALEGRTDCRAGRAGYFQPGVQLAADIVGMATSGSYFLSVSTLGRIIEEYEKHFKAVTGYKKQFPRGLMPVPADGKPRGFALWGEGIYRFPDILFFFELPVYISLWDMQFVGTGMGGLGYISTGLLVSRETIIEIQGLLSTYLSSLMSRSRQKADEETAFSLSTMLDTINSFRL